ncbi:HD domain-containing protein [bacterium]|nr:HD domain-containing protein [bacterium]
METSSELGTLHTILVPFAKPGMHLARAAVTENGRIIFSTGTVLTEGKIKILRNTYIRCLHVWDDGSWGLPTEAYRQGASEAEPSEDGGAVRAVTGLLASIQGLNTELMREKKIGVDSLRQMGGQIFGRIQKEPVFDIFLKVDKNANYLFSHMVNTAVLGVAICRSIGLSAKEIWNVFVAGMLVDVGMMQVREDLWLSDKKLTDLQRGEIEKHARFGYGAILRAKGAEEDWAVPALEHHERIDGSGYPEKKRGADLALASRILAVCDVYEALLHDRLWRKGLMPDEAIRHLISTPNLFDREIVSALARGVGIYPVGFRVKLSDGRAADVVRTHPTDLLRPTVATTGKPSEEIDLALRRDLSVAAVIGPPGGK